MACPFSARQTNIEHFSRQHSVSDLDDDLTEASRDALNLTNLNAAIQLLTAPSVSFPFADYYLFR
jgi:hypothetical protein